MTVKTCPISGETYDHFICAGGVPVYVIRKPGHSKTYALYGAHYGSMDIRCQPIDGGAPFDIPDGTAHFLEHKLFEGEGEDAFTRYARTGADANAYTSIDKTVYLFSCTENFDASFEILLDFVSHPYFTKQTVAKEQGIKMYDDAPQWRVILHLLPAMFSVNPARIDTAGTVETIAQITPEILYSCYHTFYNPANMAIVVCGDVETAHIRALCDKFLEKRPAMRIARALSDEPDTVCQNRISQKLSVAMPQFLVGYKDVPAAAGTEAVRRAAQSRILLELLFGRSSEFYRTLYEEGLINAEFGLDYDYGFGYGASVLGGESRDPDAVAARIRDTVADMCEKGLVEQDFNRAKKKIYGQNLRKLNSVENTAINFIDLAFLGVDFSEYMQIYHHVTLADCTARLKEHFSPAHCALSIIEPAD